MPTVGMAANGHGNFVPCGLAPSGDVFIQDDLTKVQNTDAAAAAIARGGDEAMPLLSPSPSRSDGGNTFGRMLSRRDSNGAAPPPPRPRAPKPLIRFDHLSDLTAPESTVRFFKRIMSEGLLLFRLALKLWSYLGVGWKWVLSFNMLLLYALLLMPGFIQMIFFYYLSPRVVRSVPYGRQSRQRLDLYLPKQRNPQRSDYPVIIFVTGGAWTIGYKAWGALLAKRLSKRNMLVACLDYKNFPQANATQMLEDVNTGIAWVFSCVHHYGGDPKNITLVGQSAGGQLGALALFRQAEQASLQTLLYGAYPSWEPKNLRAFIGVSGAYDLEGLCEHLHRRGLYKNLFEKIMSIDGRTALSELSPLTAAQGLTEGSEAHLREVVLIHGTNDKTVPYAGSVMLNEALKAVNVPSRIQLFEHKTHTSFLLEDPMCGGRDLLMEAILGVVTGKEEPYIYSMLCPKFLTVAAAYVCPF